MVYLIKLRKYSKQEEKNTWKYTNFQTAFKMESAMLPLHRQFSMLNKAKNIQYVKATKLSSQNRTLVSNTAKEK